MKINVCIAVLLTMLTCAVKGTSSTFCYQCNSYINPSCGDPFRSHFFYRNVVNCTEEAEKRHIDLTNVATFCRKNKQIVNETVRIIRDCGFFRGRENEQERCVRRSGSENIKLWNCACDDDFCNGSRTLSSQGFWTIICAVLVVTLERLFSIF